MNAQEQMARDRSNASRAADDAARREQLAEDRVVLAGLIALLADAKRSNRFVQELGLLVPAAVDGETEAARTYRALDAIARVAAHLSPLVPARGVLQVGEDIDHLRLHLNIVQHTEG